MSFQTGLFIPPNPEIHTPTELDKELIPQFVQVGELVRQLDFNKTMLEQLNTELKQYRDIHGLSSRVTQPILSSMIAFRDLPDFVTSREEQRKQITDESSELYFEDLEVRSALRNSLEGRRVTVTPIGDYNIQVLSAKTAFRDKRYSSTAEPFAGVVENIDGLEVSIVRTIKTGLSKRTQTGAFVPITFDDSAHPNAWTQHFSFSEV